VTHSGGRSKGRIVGEGARPHLRPLIDGQGAVCFQGQASHEGRFGFFPAACRKCASPKGSVLVVEAMDRLSREELSDALSQFLSIIRAGIKIVTLIDEKEFTKESVNANPFDLMYSINAMATAHGESKRSQFASRKHGRTNGTESGK